MYMYLVDHDPNDNCAYIYTMCFCVLIRPSYIIIYNIYIILILTAILKHSTEPCNVTLYGSVLEEPSVQSVLTQIDRRIADNSYPETAKPLHCRLHINIQEAEESGMSLNVVSFTPHS